MIDASKGIPTDNNIPGGLFVENVLIAGCPVPVKYVASSTSPTASTDASINAWFNTPASGNSVLEKTSDVGLGNPFNYTEPDFNPASGSAAVSGASYSNTKLSDNFFDKAGTYKGACAPGDTWWKGWTKFM